MATSSQESVLTFHETFLLAKAGHESDRGALLEPYRSYLRILASAQMGRHIELRVNASDIVQDTLLAAHRDLENFRGTTPGEFLQWLRTILSRCLLKAVECHIKAEKRDVRREVSLQQIHAGHESSCQLPTSILAAKQATPSQLASRIEEIDWLTCLIGKLPSQYQQVITLRNLKELPFEDVAQQMNRSPQAVRMLWLRAIRRLRELAINHSPHD